VTPWRWLALVVLVAAAIFAWSGGSFSEPEYLALRRDEATARHRLDSLKDSVDSLRAFRDSLVHDPVVQERMVRERQGMIRPGEIMIILEHRDSAQDR
jgi:cell division protein FtsB